MEGIKQSKQALGAEVISRFNDFAPADPARPGLADQLLHPPVQPDRHQRARARRSRSTCSAASSRTSSRSPSCRQNHALAIAIMSYNGGINFGLLADYDAMEDVDLIAEGIEDSIAELVEAAEAAEREAPATPSRPPALGWLDSGG